MSTDDFDTTSTPGDDDLLAGLHRSVAGAAMTTSAADVVALGRRTRNRHRAVAAGIGTGAAAVVAAIGMLAPSAGSGAGSADAAGTAPNAMAQRAVTSTTGTTAPSSGAQLLNIQEAGFSLEEHADGTVLLSLTDAFDPAKLQAAMDQAGIPAAILVRQLPDSWDPKQVLIRCTPDPGVHIVGPDVDKILTDFTPGASPKLKFNKSEIPAGDYVTLERFESHGRIVGGSFSIKVGRQTTCVPERWNPTSKTGK